MTSPGDTDRIPPDLRAAAEHFGIPAFKLAECLAIREHGSLALGHTLMEKDAEGLDRLRGRPLEEILATRGCLDVARCEEFSLRAAAQALTIRKERVDAAPRPGFVTVMPALVSDAPTPRRRIGKYEIVGELGHGGMGVVYKAWHEELRTHVAVKVLLAGQDASPELVQRFEREARASARLKHPGIVSVHDLGRDEGRFYIVMEYVEGADLDAVLADPLRYGIMPAASPRPREQDAARNGINAVAAISMTKDIAEAMQAAHEAGVVHRDLKPRNVLREASGRLRVMDFGLARLTDEEGDAGRTAEGAVMGTLAYMSPEQACGDVREIDARSDVYQIGATLYELLTGRPPFTAATAGALHMKVLQEDPVPPRTINPLIDRDAETICLKAMARQKSLRYATAKALAEDLDHALRGEPIQARPTTAVARLVRRVRRNPVPFALGAALCATLLGFAARWYFTQGQLNFRIKPAGAVVRIDGVGEWTIPTEGDAPPVSLPAGFYSLRVDHADHEPDVRTVGVERGGSQDVSVTLTHHKGMIEVDCEPPGSEIAIDRTPIGSAIRNRETDTGTHQVTAWAYGCFDEAQTLAVSQGAVSRTSFWLEKGLLWMEKGTMLGGPKPVPDADGDGLWDVLYQEANTLELRSGVNGRLLWSREMGGEYGGCLFVEDLDGKGRFAALVARELEHGVYAYLIDPRVADGKPTVLWEWTESPARKTEARSLHPAKVGDVDGDGINDFALGTMDGVVWILGGSSGKAIGRCVVPAYPPEVNRVDPRHPRVLSFIGPVVAGHFGPTDPQVMGCIDAVEGRVVWQAACGPSSSSGTFLLDGEPHRFSKTLAEWRVFHALSGAVRWQGAFSADLLPVAGCADLIMDLDGDGIVDWMPSHTASGRLYALRLSDGKVLWRTATADRLMPVGALGQGDRALAARGLLLFRSDESLVALDPATGQRLWTRPGRYSQLGALLADLDDDGAPEILTVLNEVGIVCLDLAGRARWTLRSKHGMSGCVLIPDLDGDTVPEMALAGANGTALGVARVPRTLWSASALGPLTASPVLIDFGGKAGRAVVQSGFWQGERSLVCFDAATGTEKWSVQEQCPPNRAQAAADWNGDGVADLVFYGQGHGETHCLYARDARDGRPIAALPTERGDMYSTPTVADLDGDGQVDFAAQFWQPAHIRAVDGRTGKILWTHATKAPNMGGMACGDLNGDGRPDLVAPSLDGWIYALNGPDGKLLWAAPEGGGFPSKGAPALADLTGDGTPEALVVSTATGALAVFDGRTGTVVRVVASVAAPAGPWGRPIVLPDEKGGPWILAAQGAAGVTAYEWKTDRIVWRGPAGEFVGASPAVGDLDGDGKREVVVGTGTGGLAVLDLETGATLWRIQAGAKHVEADPVLADLDGDGTLDVLLALTDGTLSAISGHCTRNARRMAGKER